MELPSACTVSNRLVGRLERRIEFEIKRILSRLGSPLGQREAAKHGPRDLPPEALGPPPSPRFQVPATNTPKGLGVRFGAPIRLRHRSRRTDYTEA